VDNLKEPEINLSSDPKNRETNTKKASGESQNFIKRNFHRMSKKWNPKLDETQSFKETHGDLMLEGRHGNSIRIGSRSDNPYVFISNGRQATYSYESLADGSLISITKSGTLNQHFGGYYKQPGNDFSDVEGKLNFVNGFVLVVESERTYLGDPNKKTMDNMVLGKKLQDTLKSIVDIFSKIQVLTQLGPQNILPTAQADIQKALSNIDGILSDKHFIEE